MIGILIWLIRIIAGLILVLVLVIRILVWFVRIMGLVGIFVMMMVIT